MHNREALIFLGILAVLVILALFVGLIIGDWIGYRRGIQEAKIALVESYGYPIADGEIRE